MPAPDKQALQAEVDANFEAFQRELPRLTAHQGKFALMRNGHIVNFYDTLGDAVSTGNAIYTDRIFSVQRVTDKPVDLGFLSHAMHLR
jgi:hypothetical protein